MKKWIIGLYILGIILFVTFWGTVIYIGLHFLGKFW